jgi:hypothetical protein
MSTLTIRISSSCLLSLDSLSRLRQLLFRIPLYRAFLHDCVKDRSPEGIDTMYVLLTEFYEQKGEQHEEKTLRVKPANLA